MAPLISRLRSWWDTSDRLQKIISIFGVSFLALLLFGTFYLTSRPSMKMLFGGLAPADQGAVIEELQTIGIPNQYDEKGNVYVPSERIAEARAKLATSGKLPTSGHSGIADLEKLGMMNTPKVEQERLKAILEGELAKSIETMDGVSSARVHLNMGDDGPFISEQKPASASVTIVESGGNGLSSEQAHSVAKLVGNAVPGMEMKNISILNNQGRILWDGSEQEGDDAKAENKIKAQIAESKRREKELQRVLDQAYGPGNTIAMVSLVMDFDKKFQESVEKTPHELPLTKEVNEETMAGKAGSSGGAAGADANVNRDPASPASGGGSGNQNYQGKQSAETYGSNERRTRVEGSAGNISSMAVNVLVDEKVIKSTAQVESFLKGYLGPLQDNPQFTATVTSVPFDRNAQAAADAAAAAVASQAKTQQLISILPIIALLAVGFMIMKSLGAFGKGAKDSKGQTALAAGQAALPSSSGRGMDLSSPEISTGNLAFYPSGAEQMHPMMPQMPSGGILQLPPSMSPQYPQNSQLPAGQQGALMAQNSHQGYDQQRPLPDDIPPIISNIPDKVNVPLEQIRRMAEAKPQAIAMLIKTWLSEEHK